MENDGLVRKLLAEQLSGAMEAWDAWDGLPGDGAPCDPDWSLDEYLADVATKEFDRWLAVRSQNDPSDDEIDAALAAWWAAHDPDDEDERGNFRERMRKTLVASRRVVGITPE